MRFVVVQTGARRGYAVPLIFEQAGMLERFYTDLAGNVGLGRVLTSFKWLPGIGQRLGRLSNRRVPEAVLARTQSFHSSALRLLLEDGLAGPGYEKRFRRLIEFGHRWGKEMTNAGFGGATHVYSMLSEGGTFLSAARKSGLKVVSEVYILLATERLMEKEREAFPQWETEDPDYSELRQRYVKQDVLLECSDYFVCPSEAVQDDLVNNWNIPLKRTTLVPYGMSPHWLDMKQKTVPKRVLFVGTADLRKGIHYLAMAAEELRSRGRNYDFRIAGNVTNQVRQQPLCRHLNFLGRIPRDRIHEEFQQADVFVLASLAEGSAEVTYEALGAGVPQVLTRSAGSVVRDGVEGFIVPERDAMALARAVERIVEDRSRRASMAEAARARARDFTWDKYGERLIAALEGFAK